MALKATAWKETASNLLDSDVKPTMSEAKDLVEAGDRLNLACNELKVLRNAIRSARGWVSRLKRSKIEHGETNSGKVSKLIGEYDSLLISMPEEASKLNQAIQGYCICRQPYDGFMIGCDGCDEWYHGACIGVSESQADRYDKFKCIRCCVKRAFNSSAAVVASVIQKWTDPMELKKARQLHAQKHQRKVRKEKREIEKFASETERLANELNELRMKAAAERSLETEEFAVEAKEGTAVSPSRARV